MQRPARRPIRRLLALLAPLLLALALAAAPARAQDQAKDAAKGDEGWEQVNTQMVQPGEGFQANHLVAAAYAFIWVMVAGFVYMTWRRTDAVERDLEALRRRIEKAAPPGGA